MDICSSAIMTREVQAFVIRVEISYPERKRKNHNVSGVFG
jgi:hypothetical protein